MNKEKYEYWKNRSKEADGEYKIFCIKQMNYAKVEENESI